MLQPVQGTDFRISLELVFRITFHSICSFHSVHKHELVQLKEQLLQEEVLERAKKAKEKAAMEAMEDQGLISTSLAAAPDSAAAPVAPSSPGPMTKDPFHEMLKD